MENARMVLSALAIQESKQAVVVVVNTTLDKWLVKEVVNVDNIVLIQGELSSCLDPEQAAMEALRVAMFALPNSCLISVDPADNSLLSQQSDSPSWKLLEETYVDIAMPKRMNCSHAWPTKFVSDGNNQTAFLLPPRQCLHQNHTILIDHLLLEQFNDAVLSWPMQLPYSDATQVGRAFGQNPIQCLKRHILRSALPPPPTPQPSTTPSNTFSMCLCIPIRQRRPEFFDISLTTLATTIYHRDATNLTHIRLYLAWESSDEYFQNASLLQAFAHDVMTIMEPKPPHSHIRFELIMREFPNIEQDIVFLWNSLFLTAYDDGCEYLMHGIDDVNYNLTTGAGIGWPDRFVHLLRRNGNVGAVGSPLHLNIMPFVHRTHVEIFYGQFYPSRLHNVNSDTVLWAVYKALNMLVGPINLGHWINYSDKQVRGYRDCSFEGQGTEFVPDWPEFNTALVKQYLMEIRGFVNIKLSVEEKEMLHLFQKQDRKPNQVIVAHYKTRCDRARANYAFHCARNVMTWSCLRDVSNTGMYGWKFAGVGKYEKRSMVIVMYVTDVLNRLWLRSMKRGFGAHKWGAFTRECAFSVWPSACMDSLMASGEVEVPSDMVQVAPPKLMGMVLIHHGVSGNVIEVFLYVWQLMETQFGKVGGVSSSSTAHSDGDGGGNKIATPNWYEYRWFTSDEKPVDEVFVNPFFAPMFPGYWFPRMMKQTSRSLFVSMLEVNSDAKVSESCLFEVGL